MKSRYLIFAGFLLLIVVALVAIKPTPTKAQDQTGPVIPNLDEWSKSPHNDTKAMAFNDWNDADPKEVPATCAKCHSTPGYQDFLGADGSKAGVVDKGAPIGTTITCVACHNAATAVLTSVTFPSGVEVKGLGSEARCMVCHQGRASKIQLDQAFEKYGVTKDVDKVPAKVEDKALGFINIHYFAAAATLYGTETKGGYEYEGKSYDFKNDHVAGYNTCVGCHNPHTLEPKFEACAGCHTGVKTRDDTKKIRMPGSKVDYDGDGDVKEGIASEIEGLQGMLLKAIQAYAKEKAGTGITYDAATYPYFFADKDGDGKIDQADGKNVAYTTWTARLLKAAYNYQTSIKDPGTYAHGGKYIIELLYDSIEDLNASGMSGKVDLFKAHRIDAGHFAGSEEAFRHWDEEGLVAGGCAKCHSNTGLPTFLDEASRASDKVSGVNIAVKPANGLNCATCHNDVSKFIRFEVASVKFPSGAVLDIGNKDANLCLECHQGRQSKSGVDAAITKSGLTADQIATKEKPLSFTNPHYFAAGATIMGTESKGAYEYANKKYNSRTLHPAPMNNCIACHDAHALTLQVDKCATCHADVGVKTVEDLAKIRKQGDKVDYDGDGNITEGFAEEIKTMQDALLVAIQKYAATKAKLNIVYSAADNPYFFIDINKNGQLDPDEAKRENAFTNWTPKLLRAAYNYQWVQKDPGAFAHNFYYIEQILYDSLQDIGGSAALKGVKSTMVRAPVTVPAAPTK